MKVSNYVILGLSIVVILLLVNTCSMQSRINDNLTVAVLQDSLLQKEVSRYRDSLNRERVQFQITEVTLEQLQTSQSEDLAEIKAELKRQGLSIKNTHSTTILRSTTIDTLNIISRDTIRCDSTQGSTFVSTFDWADDFMQLEGETAFTFNGKDWVLGERRISYDLQNKTSINYTYQKKFLKPRELLLTVMNDNPNTTTNKVQTYIIKEKKKWYEHWLFHQTVGAVVGATGMYLIKK